MQTEVKAALGILRNGGTILYPTDTLWGIGCDATNPDAIDKIYRIKSREPQKSMLILVADEAMAERYIDEIPDVAYDLFEVTDKPLTLVLPAAKNLAENLIAVDGSIGVRIPKDHFCHNLLQQFRRPIVSTSANLSGMPSPANFYDINPSIVDKMDYVVKWRQDNSSANQASSLIKVSVSGGIQVLRN